MKNRRLLNQILAGKITNQQLSMLSEKDTQISRWICPFTLFVSGKDPESLVVESCSDPTVLQNDVLDQEKIAAIRKAAELKYGKSQVIIWEEIKTYER
jgi:hypothetical protein